MGKPTGYEEKRKEWNKIKYGRTGEINSTKICRVACPAMFRVCRKYVRWCTEEKMTREIGCKVEMRLKWLRMDPNMNNSAGTTGLTTTWNTLSF